MILYVYLGTWNQFCMICVKLGEDRHCNLCYWMIWTFSLGRWSQFCRLPFNWGRGHCVLFFFGFLLFNVMKYFSMYMMSVLMYLYEIGGGGALWTFLLNIMMFHYMDEINLAWSALLIGRRETLLTLLLNFRFSSWMKSVLYDIS